jgi:hypothetical protein
MRKVATAEIECREEGDTVGSRGLLMSLAWLQEVTGGAQDA